MHRYKVYHYLCRETAVFMVAATAWDARKRFALALGVDASDVLAVRQ